MSNPKVLSLLMLLGVTLLRGGTNGTLEGLVKDKRTAEPVPGVNILVLPLQVGVVTGTEGHFSVSNLRAGRYDVRFSHVGYRVALLRNVIINPDLRTRITLELEPSDVELEEVTVVQEKPLIQRDITGTTYVMASEDLEPLPLDNIVDAVRLKPGITSEGNFRGGKSTEVLYLVDGLPVQDVLGGGSSTRLPNSAITGLSVYTGGFDAEYGNALSGVVNIVTKTGGNQHTFSVRADKDNLFGGTQNSRTTEFEVSGSGPLFVPGLYYLGSLNGTFTDTQWWQDFQEYFPGTVDKMLNGFAKLDYHVSPTMRFGLQVLYSHHAWQPYEFDWRYNLDGLPPEQRTSYRIAAIVSHTVSPLLAYTASLSTYNLASQIGDGDQASVATNDPYQYDFFLRYVVDGQRAWWSKTSQHSYTAKVDASYQMTTENLLRFGGEVTLFNIASDVVKYEPRKTYFGKPIVNEPQLNFSSSYHYHPTTGAIYVQTKADLPGEGILVNFGLRYEFLDPTASRPRIEAIPLADTAYAFSTGEHVSASFKHQLSPRFGAAMQLAEKGYLFVNLGWHFQYPLFDYLYSGLDRVAFAKGISAVTGNPDLEPERSKTWEISLKYSVPFDIVVSGTYFRKESVNLIDTKTFIPGDSKLAGSFGYAEFVNNPYAESEGFELVLLRDRGEWITGEISYTYQVAEGLSGSAMDGFYVAQYGLPPGQRVYPLSWDQRHTVKAITTLKMPWDFIFTTVVEWHSGRPYTNYPTSTGFEPIDGGRFYQNNARMPRYFNIDVKAEQWVQFGWWPGARVKFYVDCRNLLNEQNIRWIDSNGRVGGELDDPSGYYIGRRTSVGVQIDC